MHLSASAGPALIELLARLDAEGYDFTPPTPATHARVVARPDMREARDLRGIFGWSLPFAAGQVPPAILECLHGADALEPVGERLRSQIRVARLRGKLFIHSAYPTDQEDSVFLGPDSYRFVDFIRAELTEARTVRRLVDIGAGAGVGAISVADLVPGARLTLIDVNPAALAIAAVNADHAGVAIEPIVGEGITAAPGAIDCVIANPPFIMDSGCRAYRDGGDLHGARLSLDWTLAAAGRMERGGRMLLYTGVAIVAGRDALREQLLHQVPELGCSLRYRELDPDIFGEELEGPLYRDVERIAAVGAVVEKVG